MTLAVGVDLGGTTARAALVDVALGKEATPELKAAVTDRRPEAVADLVARLVNAVDPEQRRVGVGVGFAGMLRGWTGVVVNAPNFGWREIPFRQLLRDRVGERTELYNDLNAIAFGEAMYGGARGVRDVLCIYVGTGIGSGLVLDGKLYIGASHLAGEIGHTKVIENGRMCGCGQRGCIEAYVSGVHIQKRVQEDLRDGKRTSRVVELAGGLDKVHAGWVDRAAKEEDAYAISLWNDVASMLGMLFANAVVLLNPKRLLLGGGVWQGAPDLRRRSLEVFHALVNKPSIEGEGEADGFAVCDTMLDDAAGRLGAAALIGLGTNR